MLNINDRHTMVYPEAGLLLDIAEQYSSIAGRKFSVIFLVWGCFQTHLHMYLYYTARCMRVHQICELLALAARKSSRI